MENELIYKINNKNREEQLQKVLNILFPSLTKSNKNNLFDKVEMSLYLRSRQIVQSIFEKINDTYTIVLEYFHVNKNYRDSYYSFFSNKHFQTERYCVRVSMFKKEFDDMSYFLNKHTQEELKKNIIGFFVISPLEIKHIVRAIIKPEYLISTSSYMRLSEYVCHIYGVEFNIRAFPYQMQDTETTRCAEVTLLNILDYYANTYKEYKNAVPSDIIELERKHCHERVLPSRGINYRILTKILYDLGFSPRLYNKQTMHKDRASGITQDDEMKRLLYYYIESGIIAAVNVEPNDYMSSGHSLLCIGHGEKRDLKNALDKSRNITPKNGNKTNMVNIINSADFYKDFIVIDDNQCPYQNRDYSNLSLYDYMSVSNIVVPLYSRMFLEASDAYDIAMRIITHEKLGIFKRAKEYLKIQKNKNVITRLFLASARSYKNFKVEDCNEQSIEFKMFYSSILLLPQFIWVCELYTQDGYYENKAFGEIIIDATSAAKNGIQALISISYPSGINFRMPYNNIDDLKKNFYKIPAWEEFEGYNKNLKFIEN